MKNLTIDTDRLWDRIDVLASRFTEPDRPYTRRSFTPQYQDARQWLTSEFRAAGLDTRIDAGGNLIGTRRGADSERPKLGSGSHTDTVQSGGRFDGIAGVITALEVAHALDDSGVTLECDFDVIDFLAEEPSDFGLSRVGSRALTGELDNAMLEFVDPSGRTLREGLEFVGGCPGELASARLGFDDYAGFIELHIEQGPVLESENLAIGIVTDIVGITRVDLQFFGQADHSGTTPMDLRVDALVAASRTVAEASRLAALIAEGPDYVVATVGKLDVLPNGSNVVPEHVAMTLEVRSSSDKIARELVESICAHALAVSAAGRVTCERTDVSTSPAARCHDSVREAIRRSCLGRDISHQSMASGAGHDAACMAKVCPSGMIFIPCLEGRSHCPEESATKSQLAVGAQVLYDSILRMANGAG